MGCRGAPRGSIGLFAQEMEGHGAGMGVGAVFPDVDALPGAELQAASAKGDAEVDGGQGRAHVGGHVVGPLAGVVVDGVSVRHQPREEAVEIGPHVGVRVFLDEQGRGRVAEKEVDDAVAQAGALEGVGDLGGDHVKAAPAGADTDLVEGLAEHGGAGRGRGISGPR